MELNIVESDKINDASEIKRLRGALEVVRSLLRGLPRSATAEQIDTLIRDTISNK